MRPNLIPLLVVTVCPSPRPPLVLDRTALRSPGSEGLLASAPGRKCSSPPCWIGSAPRTRRIRKAPGARVGGAFLIPGRGAVALGGARVARSRRRSPRCGMKGVPKRHRRGLFLIWLEGWARWRDQNRAARGGGRCGSDPGTRACTRGGVRGGARCVRAEASVRAAGGGNTLALFFHACRLTSTTHRSGVSPGLRSAALRTFFTTPCTREKEP